MLGYLYLQAVGSSSYGTVVKLPNSIPRLREDPDGPILFIERRRSLLDLLEEASSPYLSTIGELELLDIGIAEDARSDYLHLCARVNINILCARG